MPYSYLRLVVLANLLWSAHTFVHAQSALYFDVESVGQSGHYLTALVGFVLAGAFDNVDEGVVALKLDGTLGD